MPQKKLLGKVARHMRVEHRGARECMAEFLGTFVVVIFITGAFMQETLGREPTHTATYLSVAVGIMMAFYMCGGVSGCFNLAVSVSMCVRGAKPWHILPWHIVGQMLGAFTATAIVSSAYTEALNNFDGGTRQLFGPNGTATIFCSFPPEFISTPMAFFDTTLAAFMLIVCCLCVTDNRNMNVPSWFYPVPIGLLVLAIVASFGLNSGAPINSAKDLGSRIFLWLAGWGTEVFSFRNYAWFWIPVVAPVTGSVLACGVYWLLIENHWPEL